jgi:hypothetical protein
MSDSPSDLPPASPPRAPRLVLNSLTVSLGQPVPAPQPARPPTSRETRALITGALAEDARCRHVGVTEGLYSLADLGPFARLGHGVPTLRSSSPLGGNRAGSDGEFSRRLAALAPFLAGFDLRANGLVLAGGAAAGILMRDVGNGVSGDPGFSDYDLFLVGHASEGSAHQAVAGLMAHLAGQFSASLEVYRTAGCITFRSRDTCRFAPGVVQVVLRQYATVGEVIHGFDLGSCSVAWDGRRVYLTALGRLAAERGANVLNLIVRGASYETRLARYFGRGYDLVLPDLDGCIFSRTGCLPYLTALGLQAQGNCSCFLKAAGLVRARPGSASPDPAPTGAPTYGEGVPYGDSAALLLRNMRAAADPNLAGLFCARADYRPGLDPFAIQPAVELDSLVREVSGAFGERVQVRKLAALLGEETATALLAELVRGRAGPGPGVAVERLRPECAARLESLRSHFHIPLVFMGVAEGTALRGPYPRDLVAAAEWYGEAYNA